MHKSFLISVLLMMCCLGLGAQEYVTVQDIHYRTEVSSDPAIQLLNDAYVQEMCTLDVKYVPGKSDKPLIVWFHGGGLTGGRKETPDALCKSGNVVVGVSYRLSPKAEIVDIIDDAAAAVAWAFSNAEKYGASASKIYIAGHSAGGYLVDMVGLNKANLAKYNVDADKLAAIVPYSGQVITHFAKRQLQGLNPLTPTIDELAPLYYVRGDCAPMLVISGDRELELYGRYEETAYFVRMMKLNGHQDITFYEEDGFNHNNMYIPGHQLLLNYIREREKAKK